MMPQLLLLPLTLTSLAVGAEAATAAPRSGLTAVEGVKVGHHTLDERPTGCTVVLVEDGAVGAVDVRGGAPGTRELALLDPVNTVQEVHAVVLSGGSAFGLDTATGVMRYLAERGVGYPIRGGPVPIVPAAILFDLGLGESSTPRPGAEDGYKAARAANAGPVAEGSVGAGAGATVGKLRGMERAMKGGVGTAAFKRDDGLVVAALVAVNVFGDVVDPSDGSVVAGVRTDDGKSLADARRLLHAAELPAPRSGEATAIGVVATNARLTQAEATKVARMAHDGLARTVYPAHTPYDGDTIFVLATGRYVGEVNLMTVGALAADAVAESILRAVRLAEGLPGLPAVRDLEARP